MCDELPPGFRPSAGCWSLTSGLFSDKRVVLAPDEAETLFRLSPALSVRSFSLNISTLCFSFALCSPLNHLPDYEDGLKAKCLIVKLAKVRKYKYVWSHFVLWPVTALYKRANAPRGVRNLELIASAWSINC